jgi:hypothetical protein
MEAVNSAGVACSAMRNTDGRMKGMSAGEREKPDARVGSTFWRRKR